ncbi:RES family NAD+ phosphorylase [Pseudactinotalea sp. HY160]|uniref:RES family NAD+ phosphorylase n=1 Tax=Pseudactinotalea sp. HY160 TaxID=2654490 RepID=UPI001883C499
MSHPRRPDGAAAQAITPPPPADFDPLPEEVPAGTRLYRIFTAKEGRNVTAFNPTGEPRGRFSFFGDPPVPVLYAAQTEIAAVCESLLHDLPVRGGRLLPEQYERAVAGALEVGRPLRLAKFHGTGLRRLGLRPEQLTTESAYRYDLTVPWAQAAHGGGFDGIVWMSARCNSDRAYVLFGDRVPRQDLHVVADYGRLFTPGPDLDWLIDQCAFMKVDVLTRSP